MSNDGNTQGRDYPVILAWTILALQIIGVVLLLVIGRDELAALTGDRTAETTIVAEATAPPPTAAPAASTAESTPAPEVDTAATESAASATTEEAGAVATAEPATDSQIAEAEVVGPESVLIESSTVAPDWLAALVAGTGADAGSGGPAMPPHLLLTFVNPEAPETDPAASDEIDLNQPQVRIIPVAALLSILEQSGSEAGTRALNDLFLLLERQPDADEAAIPVPPVLGEAVQNFVARAGYQAFGGGHGVAYLTNITTGDATPVTNEAGLNYIYQGVTADGKQYVFVSWPVDATFLPEGQADAYYESEMLATDSANYYAGVQEQVAAAAEPDLQPALGTLADLVRSLSIDGLVAAPAIEAVPATAFDAVGFTWYWTGSAAGDGEETAVDNPQDYNLVFWPDGTYNIRADCNVGSGTFTYDVDGSIDLSPGPLSRAACPEGTRDSEFVESLLSARTIAFNESGDMVLGLADGGAMILANAGPVETGAGSAAAGEQPGAAEAGLAGVVLQWPGYTNAAGETVTVENPEDYLLTLLPDGTFTLLADCNVGGGSFTYGEGGSLMLGPIRLTRAACPDGSRGADFVEFLEGVTAATVGADGAVTLTGDDGRSATFVNLGEVGQSVEPAVEEITQAAPAVDPRNTVWQWTTYTPVDGAATPIGDPEAYTLVLVDDGTYMLQADCNSGAGLYTLEETNLTLELPAMTLAACGEDSLSGTFVDFLGHATTAGVDDDGNLILTLDDGILLTFAAGGPFSAVESGTAEESIPAAALPLIGITWQWSHFRDMKQDFEVTGAYTITFNADGTASVVADCNSGKGTYEVLGDAGLNISIRAITAAACPAGSLGGSFVDNLNFAGLFAVDGDTLTIELMADGGTMTFVATP